MVLLTDRQLIKKSKLFDREYYSRQIKKFDMDEKSLIDHFIDSGGLCSPSPLFDLEYFKLSSRLSDGRNLFIFFLRNCHRLNMDTHPLVSMKCFESQASVVFNSLYKFVLKINEKRPLFNIDINKSQYFHVYPELQEKEVDLLYHYLSTGYSKFTLHVDGSSSDEVKKYLLKGDFYNAAKSYFFNYDPFFNFKPISLYVRIHRKRFSEYIEAEMPFADFNGIKVYESFNKGLILDKHWIFNEKLELIFDFPYNRYIDTINSDIVELTNLGQFVINKAIVFLVSIDDDLIQFLKNHKSFAKFISSGLSDAPIIVSNDISFQKIQNILDALGKNHPVINVYRDKFYKIRHLYYCIF